MLTLYIAQKRSEMKNTKHNRISIEIIIRYARRGQLVLFNQNIDKLFDKNTKLAKIVQNQTGMYRSILQSDTHPRFIQQYNRIRQ